jgi:hypothetical protein
VLSDSWCMAARQDHLVRVTLEVLDSLTSKDVLPPPVEDPDSEYSSTKGQASKHVRVVLASNRFKMAGSTRSLRGGQDKTGGEEGALPQHGWTAAMSDAEPVIEDLESQV